GSPDQQRLRALDEPERQKNENRGCVSALAVVGSGGLADAQRALPRHGHRGIDSEPRTPGRRDPELRIGTVCPWTGEWIHSAAGSRSRSGSLEMVLCDERRRAGIARRQRNFRKNLQLPPGLRTLRDSGSAADSERLDR